MIEPTEKMLVEGTLAMIDHKDDSARHQVKMIWKVMQAAQPQAEPAVVVSGVEHSSAEIVEASRQWQARGIAAPQPQAARYTRDSVMALWRCARKHDSAIPDEELDAMRDALLASGVKP